MTTNTSLSIRSVRLGAMPIVDKYITMLGIDSLFQRHVSSDPRDKIPVFDCLSIVLRNVILDRHPLYKIGEWAIQRELVSSKLADSFNDDRIGRALDRLFAADRATLISEVVLNAIKVFNIDLSRIHNDSTTVTLFGDYDGYEDVTSAKPRHGHNKDHRPDLKQLVFSLSVAGDHAVPLHFKAWDGNITDDTTHVRNWMSLRGLIGNTDFIYVADSKLCVRDTLQFIIAEGGSFVTVIPQTRSEIGQFQQWIQNNNPDWQKAIDEPNPRKKGPERRRFYTCDSPFRSSEGYRIIWIKSLAKQQEDCLRRTDRLELCQDALTKLSSKPHKNRDKLESSVKFILQANNSKEYYDWQVVEDTEETFKQESRGRPDETTKYKKIEKTVYRLSFAQNGQKIAFDARYDGIFPLITNRTDPAKQILEMYKYQPNLEKRFEQLKSVYNVAPVFLQNPQRIEALLTVYFISMLVTSLVERTVRQEMETRELKSIPIYPEKRECKSPTADKLFVLFDDVRLQFVCGENNRVLSTVPDELTKVQNLVLDLIGIKAQKFFMTG
jgi:transposase